MSAAASFYQLEAEKPKGDKIKFEDFAGKVVLVVNTATHCGFSSQFTGLEELHQKFKDQGLVVLGFPSDQFGHQNPEDDEGTESFCQLNHGVTFPLLKKSDVNGENTNEVFKFLKPRAKGLLGERINWNFSKFLVSKGEVLHRYAPTTKPDALAKDIEKALAESA
ncbi:glutathione peroxidase [Rhodotorula diobovata]|uniref:Glutathione peroxidase n=1 Tax=Rhodotorula diobovata TaxID=5288 RepID=A0A5C5FZQ0_9BASI|nr:glutathione peroxidase [Rhodotorula diobovata]